MRLTRERIARHCFWVKLSQLQEPKSIDNIQYATFDDGAQRVLYIFGSNERKDWIYNFAIIGVFFHLGYFLLARKIYKKVRHEKDLVIIGHSLGAGVASILYWMMRKRVTEVVLTACPASYSYINPLISKKIYNYRVKGDPIGLTKLFMRQPSKVIYLPKQFGTPKLNHFTHAYITALSKLFEKYQKSD